MKEVFKVYRVENQQEQHGLWRNFDGSWNPVFDTLTDGLSRNLPMEDSELYRQDRKQWFSSAPSTETLKHWFSISDVLELAEIGYKVYEFLVTDIKVVSDFEVIFIRKNILSQTEIEPKTIWD